MSSLTFQPFALLRHRFVGDTLIAILKQIALIVLLVEAIFLGEKFSALFESVAARNGQLGDIFLILLCTSPEVFDLALALALLLAVYQVMLRARENRELLVLAGAGVGTRQLLAVLVAVGAIAQAASMLVSGEIEPAAHYASRVVLFNAQYRALRKGAVAGQFYRFPKHVAFVSTPNGNASERRFFLEEERAGGYRVITADGARLAGPDAHGVLSLDLIDFSSYEFDSPKPVSTESGSSRLPCPLCRADDDDTPPITMQVRHVTQRFSIDQLIPFDPRGAVIDEWTMFELLGISPAPLHGSEDPVRALGDRVARGILCLLAPFLALIALAFTTRRTQPFAMPAAFLSLMALNLVDSAIVRATAFAGADLLTAGLFLAGAVLVVSLITLLVRVEGLIIRPAMARP